MYLWFPNVNTCTDPESFVRGCLTLTMFFFLVVVVVVVYLVDSREVPNTNNRGPSLNAGLVAL